ncbi:MULTISPECIES: class I SAM-dependent methyltransferase [unclassified Pseudonocardia]|uniref:class I SAM-dependent methyltransferase n=1 Tax=unclassified Pseudonocardia TaxID=2619320 RepID=UPI000761DA58|nr:MULTISPECIES: methyltransferase domain-containing protein [unclassified Pseudonocardia]
MADLVPERMELEFDTVAEWTRVAVAELGDDHAIPAACRGSASPDGLDRLVAACGVGRGTRLADVGGGTGGPAAYAREYFGADPVVVDPMPGACRAAASMFGLPAVVGDGHRIPLATGSVPACWCLGVLRTVREKDVLLGELHRILRPGGGLGLLVYTADEPRPAGAPEGNLFPTVAGTRDLLDQAGFTVVEEAPLTGFADAPRSWHDRIGRVDEVLTRDHGDDPRFRAAEEQADRIGRLISEGTVTGVLLHATAR